MSEKDQEEILIAMGGVEQALSGLQEQLVRIERLLEQIALGLGVNPHG